MINNQFLFGMQRCTFLWKILSKQFSKDFEKFLEFTGEGNIKMNTDKETNYKNNQYLMHYAQINQKVNNGFVYWKILMIKKLIKWIRQLKTSSLLIRVGKNHDFFHMLIFSQKKQHWKKKEKFLK